MATSLPKVAASSSQAWKYDVFFSFRGEDTLKTYVDRICSELEKRQIRVYKEDEAILRGDSIRSSLTRAIEESMIAVIFFSINYAASAWCLEELTHIMKCKDKGKVVPIFCDGRSQKREYGKAFEAFEEQKKKNISKVESWRKALADASNLSGSDIQIIADGGDRGRVVTSTFYDYESQNQKFEEAWIKAIVDALGLTTQIDRLTNLPEDLKFYILSKLDFEYMVQTSAISKSWVSLNTNQWDLYLNRKRILDPELLSRFPALKKLTLIHCSIDNETVGTTLKIRALELTHLAITSNKGFVISYQLTTPKLGFFEYRGFDFPSFETHEGCLPVLETAVIDFHGYFSATGVIAKLDGLLSLFAAIRSVKSLTLSVSVVHFLSLFLDELKSQESPFLNLDRLRFDLENVGCSSAYYKGERWWFEISEQVLRYLIKNSPGVKLSVIYPIRPAGLKCVTLW